MGDVDQLGNANAKPGATWLEGSPAAPIRRRVTLCFDRLHRRRVEAFGGHHVDATTPGRLVLEDLTEIHALATEWPLPPSDAQCRTIVGSLGRLHAAWWEDPRLGVTVGERLDDAAMHLFIRQVAEHFDVFADRLGDELSDERRAFYEGLIAALQGLHERYRDARNITLTHGDAHVWNCFMPRNGGIDVRWFDWEGWRIRGIPKASAISSPP